MKNIFLKLILGILKNYMNFRLIDWPFLPEKMKIGKIKKLLANLHDKSEYVIHIRNLKQALNHRLTLKKVLKVIKFNQNTWLKPYNDMKTDLRKKSKKWFRKVFSFWKNYLGIF